MSRSYRKQPFWSICGWCSRDKVFASRGERRTQDHSIRLELKNGDFEDFLLPHELECTFNNVYSWSSDGKKYYRTLDDYDWKRHLEWRDVSEEDIKVMEVEDILDGKIEVDWSPWGPSGRVLGSRRKLEYDRYHTWPPLWWRKMFRK